MESKTPVSMTPRTTRLIPPFRKPAMKIITVGAAMLLTVCNKGDAGEMGQGAFDALVATTKTKIIELSKDNGAAGKTASPRANYFVKRRNVR